jgi:hypothetical protein
MITTLHTWGLSRSSLHTRRFDISREPDMIMGPSCAKTMIMGAECVKWGHQDAGQPGRPRGRTTAIGEYRIPPIRPSGNFTIDD